MNPGRQAASLLVAALLTLVARGALADTRDIAVTLDGSAEAPSHVCVVAQTATAGYTALGNVFKYADGQYTLTTELARDVPPEIRNAYEILGQRDECETSGHLTIGELSLEQRGDLKIVCDSTTQPTGSSSPRVLVLSLIPATAGSTVGLAGIDVGGRSVIVHVTGVNAGTAVIIGTAGGQYLSGTTRVSAGLPVVLPLEPRCGWHDLGLPPLGGVGLTVTWDEPEPEKVESSGKKGLSVEKGRVLLHYSAKSGRRRLNVKATADKKVLAEWVYASLSSVPPPVVPLRLTNLRFAWRPPKLYGWQRCPTATLAETGVRCDNIQPNAVDGPREETEQGPPCSEPERLPNSKEGSATEREEGDDRLSLVRQDECHYQCALAKAADLKLPARIDFAACEDRWQESLGEIGATLGGYVDAEARSIRIRLGDRWPTSEADRRVGQPGIRVDYIELSSSAGTTYRVVPRGDVRVRFPGIQVGDYIAYRAVGDREYREVTTKVRPGGEIEIRPPYQLIDDTVGLGVALGGGGIPPSLTPLEIPAWRGYGTAEGILVFRWLSRLLGDTWFHPDVEFRAGVMIGEQWYQAIGSSEDSRDPEEQGYHSTVQVRVPLSANLVFQLADEIYAGGGLGGQVSFPWQVRNRDKLFLQGGALAQLFVGWRAAREFAFELGCRMIFPERLIRYELEPESGRSPRAEEVPALVLLVPELRARVDF